MDESKNLISPWSPTPETCPLNFKNGAASPQPIIADLAVPLPDIPALSLPDNVQFPLVLDEDSSREEEEDTEEILVPEDDYLLMDSNSTAPCTFHESSFPIAPSSPPLLMETEQPANNMLSEELTPSSEGYTPEPYETPLNILPPPPAFLPPLHSPPDLPPPPPPAVPPPPSTFSPPSPVIPPPPPSTAPPPSSTLPPPPSPPTLPPPPSRPSLPPQPSPPTILPHSPDTSSSALLPPPMSPGLSSHDLHETPASPLLIEEVDSGELYEDMVPEEEQTMYVDIEPTMPEPTYDDIPGQALFDEPRIEIMPSGPVRMTAVPLAQAQRPILSPVAQDRESNAPILTGFEGLTDEAPPSYNDLFGSAPSMPPTQPTAPPRSAAPANSRPHVPRPHPSAVSPRPMPVQPRGSPIENAESNWCLNAVNKSPLQTGIYLFIFLIGVFVPLGMLGLGIGLFLTTDTSADNTTPIFLLVMGSFASFFVCWHTTALVVGAYIKANNVPQRHSSSSCCMRVLHCGALLWWGAIGYISYRVWPLVVNGSFTLDILNIVMVGFLAFQYVMVLYCFIEAFVDCCLCIKERGNE